jgi:hypothetical protein
MFKPAIAFVLVFSLVAVGGCKRASEKLTEKVMEKAIERNQGGKADVSIKDGAISVKTSEGEYVGFTGGEGTQIPKDFPADVFVPQDAKLLTTVKVPEGFALTLESKISADKLAAECSAKMKAGGWDEQTSMVMAENLMFSYGRKTDNRTATFMIARGDKGSQMQITALTGKSDN